jgi:ABC-type sugar transport system substrate-binding protein
MRFQTGMATAAILSAVVTLAACGGEGASKSSDAGPASANNPAAAAAKNKVAPHIAESSTFSLAPLPEAPPRGKTVSFISCPLPTCQQYLDAMNQAGAKIGWTVKSYDGGLTPDTQSSAWRSVSQNPGDAVVAVPTIPNSAISAQLAALAAKNVPVVELGGPSAPVAPVIGHFNNAKQSEVQGQIWADWITADSGANAKTVYYTDSSFESLQPYTEAFKKELSSACPQCPVEVQTTNYSTGIGKSIPQQIVSYLQRNPDTRYVVINVGDASVGVPQALTAAGLKDKVKLVTGSSSPTNVKAVADGSQAMAVVGERYEFGWRAFDLIIRHLMGLPVTDPEPVGSLHVITKDNLPKNLDVPYSVPGYQDSFLRAWRVAQ